MPTSDERPASILRVRDNLAFSNGYVRVYDDDVRFSDGHTGKHLRIEPAATGLGVVVLPLRANQIGLVRTFRYPISSWQWALPRGFSHGIDVFETARGELAEEMGVQGADLHLLGHVTPDSGVQGARVAVVAALEGQLHERTDFAEVAEVFWSTPQDLARDIAAGEIEDSFTLAALFLANAKQLIRFSHD